MRNNQFEAAQYLVENKADVNFADAVDRRTSLHFAAERDNMPLLELLMTAYPLPHLNAAAKNGTC